MLTLLTPPRPVPIELRRGSAALVIVDMQNEFLRPPGKGYMPRGVPAIEKTLRLLSVFREAGETVIFVQSVRRPDDLQFTVFGRPPRLIDGSWGAEIVEELAPAPREIVIRKGTHDCFQGSEFDDVVDRAGLIPGRAVIVVCGVATHGCLAHAVTGFSVRKFHVAVPLDCTASSSRRRELIAFERLFGPGYDYNVRPTLAELVRFAAA